MLKLIIRNLWNRRNKNAWLFAEFVIVTILSWVIIDEAIVSLNDIVSPVGYDTAPIVNINLESKPSDSPQYDHSLDEEQIYDYVASKASHLPDVEQIMIAYSGINGVSSISGPMRTGNLAIDTIAPYVYSIRFNSDSKPLSLYGLEAAEGSPSIETIESQPLGENDIIITESIDRYYWPDRRGLKDKSFLKWGRDSTRMNVVGIVKDFRLRSYTRSSATVIELQKPYHRLGYKSTVIVRLKPGVDADKYIRDNHDYICKELNIGRIFVRSIESQQQMINNIEYQMGITSQRNVMMLLAALFLINLIIGVTGCVWLQTGKRVVELGIYRSYGAMKSQIIRILTGESIVLATAAFIIGDFIYLQYALSAGLSNGWEENIEHMPEISWVNNFSVHFAVVSAIVYLIIIACVMIGTYFPARHVSRIEPVDALRDE